jgi:hypothetical protein
MHMLSIMIIVLTKLSQHGHHMIRGYGYNKVADDGFLRMTGNNESFRLRNNMYVSQALVARTYHPLFFLTFLLQIYFQ